MAVRLVGIGILAVTLAALVIFALGMNVATDRLRAQQRELDRDRAQVQQLVAQQRTNYECSSWMVSLANAAAQAFVVGDDASRALYVQVANHAPPACGGG